MVSVKAWWNAPGLLRSMIRASGIRKPGRLDRETGMLEAKKIVYWCRFCDRSFDVSIEPGFIGRHRQSPDTNFENY